MSEQEKNLGFGLRELPPDDRDFALGAFYTLPPLEELPLEFFLMPKSIKDQDDSDLCTAYALTACSEDQEGVNLSPEYQFAKTKQLEGDYTTWGADLRTACKSAVKFGSLESMVPLHDVIDGNPGGLRNWENWPVSFDAVATKHRKQAYFSVEGPYDLFDNIRASLWKFRLELRSIMTGVLWRPQWTRALGGVIPNEGLSKGGFGHAFKICGWKQIAAEIYLIAQLSNGEEEGDKGFFYFPREIVNREFTFGTYMFQDLPPTETKETAIKKSQQFRHREQWHWSNLVRNWFYEIWR